MGLYNTIVGQFKMQSLITLSVRFPIVNIGRYRQALQEIRHYLQIQQGCQYSQTEYLLMLGDAAQECMHIPKHPGYLHSCSYSIPLVSEENYSFMDICYQSLMIIKEHFPAQVELTANAYLHDTYGTSEETNSLSKFVEEKREEFDRRVNSNLKALAEQNSQLSLEDVENIIYLIEHHYTKKSKIIAMKILNSGRVSNHCSLGQFYIKVIAKLASEPQLKKLAAQFMERVNKGAGRVNDHMENNRSSSQKQRYPFDENCMQMSNGNGKEKGKGKRSVEDADKYGQPGKNTLIFQLRESLNLERVCYLLDTILQNKYELTEKENGKVDAAVHASILKFIKEQYRQENDKELSTYFANLINQYYQKRSITADSNLIQQINSKL